VGVLDRPNRNEEGTHGLSLPLFHETLTEAVVSTIHAAGGFKRVAAALWPAMKLESAYARLKACVDEGRNEKLTLDELDALIAMARAANCHVIAQYLATAHGYVLEVVDADEQRRRAKKARRAALLAELARLNEEEG